jgi:hypothetical protein
MKDAEIKELLKDMFQSEEAPPVTDVEVDAFLALNREEESSAEFVERARADFAKKVFSQVYKQPIRRAERAPTFGKWIKGLRERARVGRMAAAFAIRQDTLFIDRLESGKLLPWKLPAANTALLMNVYRIHYQAVRNLITELTAERLPVITAFMSGSSRPSSPRNNYMAR